MFHVLSLLLAIHAPTDAGRSIERSQCDAPRWSSITMVGSQFHGTVDMRCTLTTTIDGDYQRLFDNYAHDVLKDTVHSGPVSTTYEGFPASKYDITTTINQEGMESVRSDVYLAGNGTDHFVMAAKSTQIQASGLAANVVKMDNSAHVSRGGAAGLHIVEISSTTFVNKPALIGVARFQSIVKSQAEKQMKSESVDTLKAIAEFL